MATQTIDLLVNAGKATGGPPLGPALGPVGVSIKDVVAAINDKTREMAGMQVPVKVHVNLDDKSFEIEIGTPPTSALIKKELGIQKGSGKPQIEMVADMPIDNIIKVAKIKLDSLNASDLTAAVCEIIGTCTSMGIEVEGMMPRAAIAAVKEGKFDGKISGKVALEEHSVAELKAKQAKMQAEIDAKHAEEEAEKEAEKAEAPAEEKPAEGEAKSTEEKPAEGKKEEAKPAAKSEAKK
jgi:large subunit ribosomal protein L11